MIWGVDCAKNGGPCPYSPPSSQLPVLQQLGRKRLAEGMKGPGQCSCWRLSCTSFAVLFPVFALPRPLCGFIYPIPMSLLPDPRPAHQVLVWAELPQAGIPDVPDLSLCLSFPPLSLCLSPSSCLPGIHPVVPLLVPSPVFSLLSLLSARSNYLRLLDGKHSVLKRCFTSSILGAHHQESTVAT